MNWKDIRTTADHLAVRNLTNRKPYRTATLKEVAKRTARKVDGRWVSDAQRNFHPVRGRE